jgi:hypothetical protein
LIYGRLVAGWVSVSCPQHVEEEAVNDEQKTLFDWTKEGRLDQIQVNRVGLGCE